MREFRAASWPRSLQLVSGVGTVLVCGISIVAIRAIPPHGFAHTFGLAIACIPPALILGALLFVVRSYSIQEGHLAIRRLLWATRVDLLGIHDAYHDPQAVNGSMRVFGNGGLFGVTGLYSNEKLGTYRLFATDPAASVVLLLHERTVVVTPAEPQAFVQELKRYFPRLERTPAQSTTTP